MIRKTYFYPILIGVIPFLNLVANNVGQIPIQNVFRAGTVVLIFCSVLFLILSIFLKKTGKAALISSSWLILFYTYGHIYQQLEGKSLFGFVYGRHMILMGIWSVLIIISLIAIIKFKEPLNLTLVLNTVSLFLLLFPMFQIGTHFLRNEHSGSKIINGNTSSKAISESSNLIGPDIYYIILDGYSRADVIEDLYDYDISQFLNELKSLGFVIPNCAQSNYGFTGFSISSTLNMNYVDTFALDLPWGSSTLKYEASFMHDYIRHNLVRQELEQQGYKMIAFETGKPLLDVDDADYFFSPRNISRKDTWLLISEFEDMFIRTTMLRMIVDGNSSIVQSLLGKMRTPNEQQYLRAMYVLDKLSTVHDIPGKKFVLFHIMAPHPPYVFDSDGNLLPNEEIGDIPGYIDEVAYLNKRILQIVNDLINNSNTPPIIIVQGDHGWDPDPQYKMKILNAYYLPNGGDKLLYSTITPVNSFRLIMNFYFNKNYDLLPDESYYSLPSPSPEYLNAAPYSPILVPIQCPDEF